MSAGEFGELRSEHEELIADARLYPANLRGNGFSASAGMIEELCTALESLSTPPVAHDSLMEVKRRLLDTNGYAPSDAMRMALLHIEAYEKGIARPPVAARSVNGSGQGTPTPSASSSLQ